MDDIFLALDTFYKTHFAMGHSVSVIGDFLTCTTCGKSVDLGTIDHINDSVNHPKHYNEHPSGVECIQITRHMTFNTGNAIKYIWRSGKKDSTKEIEDLQKAVFYLNDEIERLKSANANI